MDIFFDVQGGHSGPPAFTLRFDPEAMSLQCIGDMATIMVQAYLERRPNFWNSVEYLELYPVLPSLHGILYSPSLFQGNQGIGAALVASESFPLELPDDNSQLLNLSFHCSRSY